ncbi:MAG: dipeptidase [Gemmatimonadales bacterium]
MSITKRGTEYESFSYLAKGTDYREFELAAQVGRVESHLVELTDEEEARATRLVTDNIMISLHDHLGIFPADMRNSPHYTREGRMATAFKGLAQSHWDAVFDNMMDGLLNIYSRSGWKWTEVLHDLGMRLCDLAHQDFVVHCTEVGDIQKAHDEGRIAWIAAQEGAAMIENELDRIDILYGFGLRALGIAYSEANSLGSGLREPRDGGLTIFGRRAVERMNKIGMLIDCSHCGDRTTLDVIEASEQPIVLSHIGARALWESNRMAPDDVLEACAKRGGVIGVEAAPHTTLTRNNTTHNLDAVMEHFEYIRGLVGIDHVGFGPDTAYGDHVQLHDVYAANLSIKQAHSRGGDSNRPKNPPYEKVEYVEGIENPTEASQNIVRWLVKHGYSDEDIIKAMGGNAMRLLRAVWV